MTAQKQIDKAMLAMDSDPQLAAEFDKVRASEFPNKTRREAAELALAALESKRNAGLAGERAKALKHLASTAAAKFKSFVTMGRPDKRQPALPLDQWGTGHLMQAAERGDDKAVIELTQRGYSLSGKTFTKKA